VEVAHAQEFEMLSFTVEALVHPDTIGDTGQVIVRNISTSGGWALSIVPGNDPDVDGCLEVLGTDGAESGGPLVPLELSELGTAWHVAVTYEKGTNIVNVYKDSVEVAGGNFFPYAPNLQEPLQIGVDFQGAIQEVAVYRDVVLKEAQIADHFMATQPPQDT
jgi:hypothetical protein